MSKATITVKCKSCFVKNLTFKIEVHGEVAVEDRNEDLVKYGDIQSTRVGLQTDLHTQIQHILLGHLQLTGLEPRRDNSRVVIKQAAKLENVPAVSCVILISIF